MRSIFSFVALVFHLSVFAQLKMPASTQHRIDVLERNEQQNSGNYIDLGAHEDISFIAKVTEQFNSDDLPIGIQYGSKVGSIVTFKINPIYLYNIYLNG